MILKTILKKNTYQDSVNLMLISKELSQVKGIIKASIMMGTHNNRRLMEEANLLDDNGKQSGPNDMIIAILGESEDRLREAFEIAEEHLTARRIKKQESGEIYPRSLPSALKIMPDANLAIISVPGQYAKTEAMKAMKSGLHVLLFSDNVPIEEEIELKKFALKEGLLMMGPDCGTAIINGVPLAFANRVKRGNIGIIGAAGTGIQEVSCIISRLGKGISQAIGVGGRDLKKEVGGMMMFQAIDALELDDETHVIILLSKPPDREVRDGILYKVKSGKKRYIINFLGEINQNLSDNNIYYADTLVEAAEFAVLIESGEHIKKKDILEDQKEEIKELIRGEIKGLSPGQKYIRGLFAGGTMANEAILVIEKTGRKIYSNIAKNPELLVKRGDKSKANTVLDLGEDEFTVGRPHPMIDYELRKEYITNEAKDPEVAVILLDIELGFGSNPDPAKELRDVIMPAKELARKEGKDLAVVASICGVEGDPQDFNRQLEEFRKMGVIIAQSNCMAARIASMIAERR